jgi:uncharacterized membrane protein YuzA (DUF378 family)
MRLLHTICLVLVILGALNWGLWGLDQVDLVARWFGGSSSQLGRGIYLSFGLAGLLLIFTSSVMHQRYQGPRRWARWY